MFRNKVAVITGGALGIGKHNTGVCKEGAKVAFIDIDLAAGEDTKAGIIENGGDLCFSFDLAKEKILKDFTKKVIEHFGRIDYLINNAMISKKAYYPIAGMMILMKFFILESRLLICLLSYFAFFNTDGAVVNISSTRAFQSQRDTESYTAAKGGITSLTHALAVSLAGKIRVNSISPGWIDTGITYDKNYIPSIRMLIRNNILQAVSAIPMDIVETVFFCAIKITALLMVRILPLTVG